MLSASLFPDVLPQPALGMILLLLERSEADVEDNFLWTAIESCRILHLSAVCSFVASNRLFFKCLEFLYESNLLGKATKRWQSILLSVCR